jgi:MFS family permease
MIFSTYVMITLTVTAAGQMMTLLYDPFDMHLFAITSVLVSIAAIPVVLSTSPSPEQPHQVEVNIRKLIRISPAGALGCLAHGLITGSFWSLAPVFTAGASDNVSLAAWFMTSAVIGGAVAQWPLGFLSDRIGRRKMMAAICLAEVALVVVLLTLMKESGVTGLVLFGAAWGFVAFPVYAIAVAHANDFAEADEYVMVSSGLLLMYGGGAIIGPFIASALMTLSGGSALFVFSGVIHLALAIYVITRIFRRESVPTEHHISFGDALATAHTASQVYDEEIQYHADEEEEDVPG